MLLFIIYVPCILIMKKTTAKPTNPHHMDDATN